jgi:phosphatidylserine decarboxylase
MKYYSRQEKKVVEEIEEYGKLLAFLYNTTVGRLCLKSFVARPWFSNLRAKYMKSKYSVKDIETFVKKHGIEIDDETLRTFKSFNDFFIRSEPTRSEGPENELVAAATSKFSYYPITDDLKLSIKKSQYTVADILENEVVAERFKGGTCLVFRLAVSDYHRYCYIDDGKIVSNKFIPGELHTVRSISEKYNVYARNCREVTLIQTEHLGEIAYIEVGALMVGKIKNNGKTPFNRFDEKGYFEFGGSTVVMLLNKDVHIRFDEDIIEMSRQGLETQVEIGERIGMIG